METVFILWHTHTHASGDEDEKCIGVYSSKSDADAAQARLKLLPGFAKYPEGFAIAEYQVNRDHWNEGFDTETPNQPPKPTRPAGG